MGMISNRNGRILNLFRKHNGIIYIDNFDLFKWQDPCLARDLNSQYVETGWLGHSGNRFLLTWEEHYSTVKTIVLYREQCRVKGSFMNIAFLPAISATPFSGSQETCRAPSKLKTVNFPQTKRPHRSVDKQRPLEYPAEELRIAPCLHQRSAKGFLADYMRTVCLLMPEFEI